MREAGGDSSLKVMQRWTVALLLTGVLATGGCASPASLPLTPRPIDGYRVVYRVEDRTQREPRISTEVVEVRRPYDGRVEFRRNAPPGGDVSSGQVTNREHLWQLGEDGALRFGLRRVPAGPARDASYPSLLDAARAGAIDLVGAGEVLGRRCSWFAYGDPSPQLLKPATKQSRVESCVDARGIVLREVWQIESRVARISEAVSVRPKAPGSSRFLLGKDPANETLDRPDVLSLLQGASVVDDDAVVEIATELRPPTGWRLDRRSVASAATGTSSATQFLAESYIRGSDLVVVERGTDPALRPVWPPDEGVRRTLGALGEGRLVYFVDRVELRLLGNVGFIRIAAPTARVALAFVRGLHDRR